MQNNCQLVTWVQKSELEVVFHPENRGFDLIIFSQDGQVTLDEFHAALEQTCKGKSYDDFPLAFKFFINASFKAIDFSGICNFYINL